jgi:hypothetical protein
MSDYYRLTAEGRGDSETVEYYSASDGDAMMEAMFSHILATDASPVWGYGEIILRNVTTGEIVNTMDAKD